MKSTATTLSAMMLCLVLGQGCATCVAVTERCSRGAESLYPATGLDVLFWACACLPRTVDGPGGVSDYSEPGVWLTIPLATVATAVDLVPSLATDTVLLPVDWYQSRKGD